MSDSIKPCTDCGRWLPLAAFPERTRRTRTGYPIPYRLGVCWHCQRAREAVWRAERNKRTAQAPEDPWAPF